MNSIDVLKLSVNVLNRLVKIYSKEHADNLVEQLIFPKIKDVNRISEQELRILFIEEFKLEYKQFFYSVENPTIEKYSFGKKVEDIKSDKNGRSASTDMCIYQRVEKKFNRILNIEFKFQNSQLKNISKDIFKLICENENGVFMLLLETSDNGTLRNKGKTGVFNKFYDSIIEYSGNWINKNKIIEIFIISIKEGTIISREIKFSDLNELKSIFFEDVVSCGTVKDLYGNGWINEKNNKVLKSDSELNSSTNEISEIDQLLEIKKRFKDDEYGYNRYLDSLHLKASELYSLQTEAEFKVKFEIAENLLKIGLSIDDIIKATGLNEAMILKLKSEK